MEFSHRQRVTVACVCYKSLVSVIIQGALEGYLLLMSQIPSSPIRKVHGYLRLRETCSFDQDLLLTLCGIRIIFVSQHKLVDNITNLRWIAMRNVLCCLLLLNGARRQQLLLFLFYSLVFLYINNMIS